MKSPRIHSSRTWLTLGLAASLWGAAGMALAIDEPPASKPDAQPAQPAPQDQPQQPRAPRGGEGGQGRPQPGREGGRPVVSVEASMKIMGRSLKALKANAGDAAKRDENLRLVNEMQRGCVTAKGSPVPEDLLKKAASDADKAKVRETYRKGLVDLLRKLIDLEDAIADGKGDAAKGLIDEVVKLRDKMHEDLGVKDE